MHTSPTIGTISASLAKAQKVIKPAVFDRTNPHFKNKYAALPSVVEAVRAALADNQIAILQGAEADGAQVKVTTMLAHASGEWISSTLTLTATQNNPQGVGSAITYGRRFGLCSLVCVVADEDDDGEQASVPTKAPASKPVIVKEMAPPKRTAEERKRDIVAELKGFGYEPAGINHFVRETLGHDKAKDDSDLDRLESALVIIRATKNADKAADLNY